MLGVPDAAGALDARLPEAFPVHDRRLEAPRAAPGPERTASQAGQQAPAQSRRGDPERNEGGDADGRDSRADYREDARAGQRQ